MVINRFVKYLVSILFVSFISGCFSKEKELLANKEQEKKYPVEVIKRKLVQDKRNKPIVTSTKPKMSKPISNSAGNAKDNRFDEIYIVPNQFPFKNKMKDDKSQELEKSK